jgi:hypothetical protein
MHPRAAPEDSSRTYLHVFDVPVYVDRLPIWTGKCYVDADTGEALPTGS